jgi:NAD(P)-dependent dehydrogenase (short-subunit alcohol dehydrogenase family)
MREASPWLEKMKLFVIGATRAIGHDAVQALVGAGYSVTEKF